MAELAAHLRALRADLVETMAVELTADGDWHSWLPLLAQVQVALRAVEAVMEERAGSARTQKNASSRATETAPKGL